MPKERCKKSSLLPLMVLLALALALTDAPTQAETYIAGQVGVTLPQSASNVDIRGGPVGFPAGTTTSDLDLQNALMYGAKIGHYFDRWRWLGVETEVFNTTPHLKQQSVTTTLPSGFAFTAPASCAGSRTCTTTEPGQSLRVLTWAPVNLLLRYPGERLQPYAAVGLGLFFAQSRTKTATVDASQSSTSPGLNTQVGLRYFFTKQMAAFGEWKFNHTRLKFDQTANQAEINGDYNVHHLAFGVGYHF